VPCGEDETRGASSPISPSPAISSSSRRHWRASSVSDKSGRKSLLGTQTLPHSPTRAAPRSPMSGGALGCGTWQDEVREDR